MGYLRKLMERYNFSALQDRLDLIPSGANSSGREQLCLAKMGADKISLATSLVYTPYGDPISIDTQKAGWTQVNQLKAQWFNPRSGEYIPAYRSNLEEATWQPPFEPGRGNDWILIVEQ